MDFDDIFDEGREINCNKNKITVEQITNKLGFDIKEYNKFSIDSAHENDNIPNPFDVLSLDELLFLRENNYLLDEIK